MRIGLVGCVKGKGPAAARAADLYVSPLFVGRRRFVEQSCDRWFILSALHGLVDPDDVVAPYDQSLVGARAGERRAWTQRVLASIDEMLGDVGGVLFEVHAGAAYRDHGLIDGVRRRGATVEVPAAGLSQGRQLAFYANRSDGHGGTARRPPLQSRPSSAPYPAGGYTPLSDLLHAVADDGLVLTFADLERTLGRALPASARQHRPWWANNGRSPQARAWLGAGWQVAGVDLATRRVSFQRATT